MSSERVKKVDDLWHRAGMQLKEEMSNTKYSDIAGLSMADRSILQIIEKNPQIIFKEICAQLGLPKSTLTSAVNRLEKKGLVTRNASVQDKRAYFLQLTESGMHAQQEHLNIEYAVFEKLLQRLSDREADTLIRLLSKALKC